MKRYQSSAQRGSSSRLAKVALPAYVKNWPRGVYRPGKLPDNYNERIDSNHIFALPEKAAAEVGYRYIIPYPCKRCVHSKKLCSRGQPCVRCSQLGYDSSCEPKEKGWLPLPLIREPDEAAGPAETKATSELSNNARRRSTRRYEESGMGLKTPGKLENASDVAVASASTRKSARILRVQNLAGSLSARALRAEERAMKSYHPQPTAFRSSGVGRVKQNVEDASEFEEEAESASRAYISRTSSLSSLSECIDAADVLSSPLLASTSHISLHQSCGQQNTSDHASPTAKSPDSSISQPDNLLPTHNDNAGSAFIPEKMSSPQQGASLPSTPQIKVNVVATTQLTSTGHSAHAAVEQRRDEPERPAVLATHPVSPLTTGPPDVPAKSPQLASSRFVAKQQLLPSFSTPVHSMATPLSLSNGAVSTTSSMNQAASNVALVGALRPSTHLTATTSSSTGEPSFRLSTSAAWNPPDADTSESELSDSESDQDSAYLQASDIQTRATNAQQASVSTDNTKRKRPTDRHIQISRKFIPSGPRLIGPSSSFPQPSSVLTSPPQYQRPAVEAKRNVDEGSDDSEEEVVRCLKRPRNSDSTTSPAPPPRSSEETVRLTFVGQKSLLKDSVVVQVQSTLYHLPRTRLERHSRFFAELIAQNNATDTPPDYRSGIDRCPVIQVNAVSSKDFELLLKTFENIGGFIENPPGYPDLLAIFCAARALKFGQIDAIATYKLGTLWTPELSCVTPDRIPFPAETVFIARKYGVPSLLKRAFYELLRTEGFAQLDLNQEQELPMSGSDFIGRAMLNHTDLVRLITARERLTKAWTALARSPPRDTCPLQAPEQQAYSDTRSIHMRLRCAEARQNSATIWDRKVMRSGLFTLWMLDPVCGLDYLARLDWSDAGLCESCVSARQELWQKKRDKIWDNLDEWLGL